MGRDTRSSSNKKVASKKKIVDKKQKPPVKRASKNQKGIQKGQIIKKVCTKKKINGQVFHEEPSRQMRVRAGILDKQSVQTICLNNTGTSEMSKSNDHINTTEKDRTNNQNGHNHTNGKGSNGKHEMKSKQSKSKKENEKIEVSKIGTLISSVDNMFTIYCSLKMKDTKRNANGNGRWETSVKLDTLGLTSTNSNNSNASDYPSATTISQSSSCSKPNSHATHKPQRTLAYFKNIKEQDFSQYINSINSTFNGNQAGNNDSHKNSTHFLGKEYQFSDYSIIVGSFSKQYSEFYGNTFIQEAKIRGFNLEIVYDDKEFLNKMNNFDIAWIVDNAELNKKYEQRYIDSFKSFFQSKKSLYIHAGANKFYFRSNLILSHFFGKHLFLFSPFQAKTNRIEKLKIIII